MLRWAVLVNLIRETSFQTKTSKAQDKSKKKMTIRLIQNKLCVMDMECSCGLMEHTTKATGPTTKQKAREPSGMLKVMCIVDSSEMTWPMDRESTLT